MAAVPRRAGRALASVLLLASPANSLMRAPIAAAGRALASRAHAALAPRTRPLASADGSPPPAKKRVLSGVQPTGVLHLGNYLGAIRQWVDMQDEFDNFFCVVDLHAITSPHVPKELTESTYRTAALYLACGIDPKRSRVFVQSHVRAHAELCWLLNCVTPMGWLEKMIQFKEKSTKQGESVAVGLLDYPVLMAADILLYRAQLVPVGEDQRQHLELTRDIARRFHDQFCNKASKRRPTFVEPDALILKESARIMSLQDGTAKMSKSAESELSRIELLDTPDEIFRKIKKCKTDAIMGLTYGDPARPEATNLINIYQAVTGVTHEQVLAEVGGMSWGDFKPRLAEAVVAHLEPIQRRYNELVAEPEYLRSVLAEGAEEATKVADMTLGWAKDAMGIVPPGAMPILSPMPTAARKQAAPVV
ncbi:trpS protein [Pavlovales sp. CCMP2436]|nr:trpS protein [Pavlovales sp. CCMP2436]